MFDAEYDFLVVGTGAAGLAAAVTAQHSGLSVLVVEKTDMIGGTTAYSGGGVWIPANHVMRAAGVEDNIVDARRYLDGRVGDVGPASSPERRTAYLELGPKMVRFLERAGFRWHASRGYPDYYSEDDGARKPGRQIEGHAFNVKKLGAWAQYLRSAPGVPPVPLYNNESPHFLRSFRTLRGFLVAAKVIGWRSIASRLAGKRLVTNGKSLVGQLLKIALDRHIPVWLNSPVTDLITDNGAVMGAVIDREGKQLRVKANRGVLLSTGGFSLNEQIRREHQPGPVDTAWTLVGPGDTGDAVTLGTRAGGALALMDKAWWMPTMIDPATHTPVFLVWERSLPHSIVVDSTGHRFVNESTPYLEFGQAMLDHNDHTPSVPSWLIFDTRHRNSYPFTGFLPHLTPKAALTSGFLTAAGSIEELAAKIDIDPAALRTTVDRFNRFARTGTDEDFHRGDTTYDNWFGDPSVGRNPNLGTLQKAPFYAVKVWPGDLGTKGGLLTDEHGQVLREDATQIAGLYATGNATASVMGNAYPGPGATIGPAMVFGYAAALHAAQQPTPTT